MTTEGAVDVELRLFATFRAAVGQKTITREFPEGVTIREVLEALEAEFDDLAGQLLADGAIPEQLNVLKNGQDVRHGEGLEGTLTEGDRLSLFPPVAGG